MTSDPSQPPRQASGPPEPAPDDAPGRQPASAPEAAGDDTLRAQHLDLDTLSAYLDRQLPPAELAAIQAHLATCSACGRELAELRATVALLRDLPHYVPRRSFQLGPEHARGAARGASGFSGWFERLIPALPALRVTTVAVAVLLLAVIAGDLVLNQGAAPAPMLQTERNEAERGTAPEAIAPAGQPAPAPAVGPAGQSAPANEGLMPRSAAMPTSAEAADQAAGGQPAEIGTEPEAPASIEAEDRVEDAPPVVPPAAEPAPPDAPSWWRLAQVGLGLALLWLIVTLAGVAWLRRDRP